MKPLKNRILILIMLIFPCIAIAAATDPLVSSINDFSFELFGQVTQDKNANTIISPYSVVNALLVCYQGASGNTAKEMAKLLHISAMTPDTVNKTFQELMQQQQKTLEKDTLLIANALWLNNTVTIKDSFLTLGKEYYQAHIAAVDFSDPNTVAQIINDYVAENTKNNITSLIDPSSISVNSVLVIVNAIYFKGTWDSPFKPRATQVDPFYIYPHQAIKIPIMHQQLDIPYAENEVAQWVMLPYANSDISMAIILPKKADELERIALLFNDKVFNNWLKQTASKTVIISLPKFKFDSTMPLNDVLKALGMKDAFTAHADFSGITASKFLIDLILQKAMISVDEEGTTAAAATEIIAMGAAAPNPAAPRPIVFNVDHPFLVVIYDHATGLILFIGKVVQPSL